MNEKQAIEALGALGQIHRLRVFRLLVTSGLEGMPAGAIAEHLDVPPSTLSSHLAQLQRAGLLSARRESRQIHYAVDLDGARQLLGFLMQDCCQGHPEICGWVATIAEGLESAGDASCAPAPDRSGGD
ncbi:MAG: metalloregulator ArsR/SmtB family transcription factor [Alphaproteobacteria bacterium]|nr:metalloregulator ArsR/SmtB family transcription factor [Alphaproteobacteria bacterium]